jgi:hypothetical protein
MAIKISNIRGVNYKFDLSTKQLEDILTIALGLSPQDCSKLIPKLTEKYETICRTLSTYPTSIRAVLGEGFSIGSTKGPYERQLIETYHPKIMNYLKRNKISALISCNQYLADIVQKDL